MFRFLRSFSLVLVSIHCGCTSNSIDEDPRSYVCKMFGIDESQFTVLHVDTSYEGFPLALGGGATDGDYIVVLKISEENKAVFGRQSLRLKGWKALPFSEEIKGGRQLLESSWPKNFEPFNSTQGSYYFVDRYSSDQYLEKPFYERWSFNVTFAVYDESLGLLYFQLLDT